MTQHAESIEHRVCRQRTPEEHNAVLIANIGAVLRATLRLRSVECLRRPGE